MTTPDCPLEALSGCAPLSQRNLSWFKTRGVSPFALLGYRLPPQERDALEALGLHESAAQALDPLFHVAVARVHFLRRRRFAFADVEGEEDTATAAFVFPEIDHARGIADLVAWTPGRTPASWRGRVGILGAEALDDPSDEPLVVHPSPLEWLRSWRSGIVVVDEALARPVLLTRRPLVASDVDHGQALRAMITKALPDILVAPDTLRGAA